MTNDEKKQDEESSCNDHVTELFRIRSSIKKTKKKVGGKLFVKE